MLLHAQTFTTALNPTSSQRLRGACPVTVLKYYIRGSLYESRIYGYPLQDSDFLHFPKIGRFLINMYNIEYSFQLGTNNQWRNHAAQSKISKYFEMKIWSEENYGIMQLLHGPERAIYRKFKVRDF